MANYSIPLMLHAIITFCFLWKRVAASRPLPLGLFVGLRGPDPAGGISCFQTCAAGAYPAPHPGPYFFLRRKKYGKESRKGLRPFEPLI